MAANRYALDRKVAIVTGGAGGIGRAVARRFLDSGAAVVLWDRDAAGLDAAAAALGPGVTTMAVDITEEEAVEAATAEIAARGRIDILVNNAGILGDVAPIWESDPARFRKVLEVNLVGPYLATRAVVARMRAQAPAPSRGRIVNVSSIQGKEGLGLSSAYSSSKAGLLALTKVVAKETARDDIVVTAITPAAAETAMALEITAERRAEITSRIPAGRFVTVEEIAAMVAFLSSDDCSFSTGGIFDLSGGRATY